MIGKRNMTSVPSEIGDLDLMILNAAKSPDEIDNLIRNNIPFIQSRVQRYASGASASQKEDLFSIAMMAFYEAVKTFQEGKGHFYPFADLVIRRRLIDEFRKASKNEDELPILDDDAEGVDSSAPIQHASIKTYEKESANNALILEIEQYKEELKAWNITMALLEKNSPKHKALKDTYKGIISAIMNDQEILSTIITKRYYPIKRISEITKIPQRKLERSRIYVIAVILIIKGNYEHLSSYIDIPRGKWL